MKNLVTKRRSGAISLLVALVMFAAGMLASIAPVHAASAAFGKATFVLSNPEGTAGTITYSHSFTEPVLFVTQSSTHGAHNVPVPEAGASEPFGPDWGHIAVQYLDPTTNTWKPAGEYTVPSSPVTPTPVQSAAIAFEGDPGSATISLASGGVSGLDGVGYFHIILNGDLSGPSIALPAGAGTFRFLTGLKVGDVIEVRVYGSGDGTGALLARAVVPDPPVGPTPTPTPTETTPLPDDTDRKIQICHATHPRAEAYESIEVSVAAILAGHGQHEGDIIPPFAYVKQGVAGGYAGNRWTEEGIDIFNNGCTAIPEPTETTTASPSPSTTETATANPSPSTSTTATATQSPSNTQSATSTPSSSSTSVAVPWTAEATPSESATAKVSRYPAALVDTAVKGGDERMNAPVLFGGAAIAALLGLLLIRSGPRESRRH